MGDRIQPVVPGQKDRPAIGEIGNDLVGLIYDTALNAEMWPALFEQLARFTAVAADPSVPSVEFETQARKVLLPHFERALKLSGDIYQLKSERNLLKDMLDRIPVGIVIVQGNARIVFCNCEAEQLIDAHEILRIDDGVLQFHGKAEQSALLTRTIRQVANGASVQTDFSPSLTVEDNGTAETVSLWVSPVRDMAAAEDSTFAAVLIVGAKSCHGIDADTIASAFGLSPAEGRLAKELLGGSHSLPEAALAIGISVHTARTQMKSIFSKMGVSSQSEMIKQILTTPSMFFDAGREQKDASICPTAPAIDDESFRTLRLSDGRILEYREYGDPRGKPVIFLHSMVHSRLLLHPFSNYAERQRLRIIAPERPGYGLSEMLPKRTMAGYAEDIGQLASSLGIRRFYMVGDMDGSAYVLACASQLPERIIAAAAIACLPRPEDDALEKLISFERTIMQMVRRAPIFINSLGRMLIRGIQKNPDKYFERFGRELCEPDRRVFATQEHRQLFRETFENITPENMDGFIDNYFARLHAWDFEPAEITVPVHLWHGEQDQRSPIRFARKLAMTIPECHAHFIADGGHCIFYTHWDEILGELIRD